MMKSIIAVLAFVMVAQAHAQTEAQVQGGIEGDTGAPQSVQVQAVQQRPGTVVGQAAPTPVIIMNNQRVQGYQGSNQGVEQSQGQIQEQPVTVIQEAPLRPSGAEQVRKQRERAENQTEDTIAQALERARLDDEVKRRDKFNGALTNNESAIVGNNNTVTQTNVVQQQQVDVAPVAPVVIPKPKPAPIVVVDEDIEIKKPAPEVKTEIRTVLDERDFKKHDVGYTYVSGLLSFGSYDNDEVTGNLGGGVAFGMVTDDRIVIEGLFQYNNYEIGDNYSFGGSYGGYGYDNTVDLRQYNFGAAVKYQLFTGKFRPNVGAALNYARRNYDLPSYYGSGNYGSTNSFSTDAIDAGLVAGADLVLSSSLAIGLDFRYMTNLGYRASDGKLVLNTGDIIEELDYYTIGLVGKFTF